MPRQKFALILLIISLTGCGLIKEKQYAYSEAEKKFAAFCLKEGNTEVVLRQAGKTEWIYLPLNQPLFELKVTPTRKDAARKITPLALLSLEGEYNNRTFSFDFDTIRDVAPPEPTDYGSAYTESYIKKRQLIYQAIQETFFNMAKDPQDNNAAPEFFVLLIADTTKGLATKNTIYLEDLRAYISEAVPSEEYYQRELTRIIGDEGLIGDTTGKNLVLEAVKWPVFLTEQIKARVRFQFTQSDFPPSSDPSTAIATIAANTLRLYPFRDYDRVTTYDRRGKENKLYTLDELKKLEEKPLWQKDQGRFQIIRFDPKLLNNSKTHKSDRQPAAPDKQAENEWPEKH